MKRLGIATIALCALALSGCDEVEQRHKAERQQINRALPSGCEMRDLGSYATVNYVIVVICDGGRTTASSSYQYNCGKGCTRRVAVLTIEG